MGLGRSCLPWWRAVAVALGLALGLAPSLGPGGEPAAAARAPVATGAALELPGGLTQAEAVAVVRQVVAAGWGACSGTQAWRVGGYRARVEGDRWTVAVSASATDPGTGDRLTTSVVFWVYGPADVRAASVLSEDVLRCSGTAGGGGPVVEAIVEKGLVEPGQTVELDFTLRDASPSATVYLNLYEGGRWKLRREQEFPLAAGDPTLRRLSLPVELPAGLVGPLFFCVWAENALGQESRKAPKSSCKRMSLLVDVAEVSNGCGGEGWDAVVAIENYFGNTATFRGPNGERWTVDFRPACNLHDAGYGGHAVRDALHGDRPVDFQLWTRRQVDTKFERDMEQLCRAAIPVDTQPTARSAFLACRDNVRGSLVERFGHRFFDANLEKPGTQAKGPRANYGAG